MTAPNFVSLSSFNAFASTPIAGASVEPLSTKLTLSIRSLRSLNVASCSGMSADCSGVLGAVT